jgi:hypothetical protein
MSTTPTLVVADDFHPDPVGLRIHVTGQRFQDEIGPDGERYRNILTVTPNPRSEALEAFGNDMNQRISKMHNGRKVNTKLSFFRLDMADDVTKSFCHADSICARYAGILYLNEPDQCFGGTALWTHIGLDLDRLPSNDEVSIFGSHSMAQFHSWMTAETKNPAQWRQSGFVAMKFNRFVSYPSKMFHSRWPHQSFGESNANGRLVWVTFYDLE